MKTKEENNEYQKKWYAKHKDEINSKRRQQRFIIKDKVNEQEKKYYYSHRDKILFKAKQKAKLFRLTHPKKILRMKEHPSWKGGIIKENGYKLIRMPEHKRNWNGYVQEHILIMEKYLGRDLLFFGKSNPNNEVVHHEDEDKLNNSLDNLKLMTHKEHLLFHNPMLKNGN